MRWLHYVPLRRQPSINAGGRTTEECPCGRRLSRWGCVLLVAVAGTQVAQAKTYTQRLSPMSPAHSQPPVSEPTAAVIVPTVAIRVSTPATVPTVTFPQPTAVPTPTAKPRKQARRHRATHAAPAKAPPQPKQQWIDAFLT